MRTFVVGDIHGAYRALVQVLDKVSFDPKEDKLIVIGDVCDGWPETYEVVDYLLQCDNVVSVLGNHDLWFLDWLNDTIDDISYNSWYRQGGASTIRSYSEKTNFSFPQSHIDFVANMKPYHIENNKLYVHGGFIRSVPLHEQDTYDLVWDRSLWYVAKETQQQVDGWDDIFIGHTTIGKGPPVQCGNVINLDTGAGWDGVLTLMNVDTKKYVQSDLVMNMYPESNGRF